MTNTTGTSIRALITELAQVEEALGRARTFPPATSPGTAAINPELPALLQREQDLVSALRRTSGSMPRPLA